MREKKSRTKYYLLSMILIGSFQITLSAQSFTAQTGASNPLNGEDVGFFAAPAFIDLDNDGDLDAMIGSDDGTVYYFENTGSASSPSFTQRTGGSNPMNGYDVGFDAVPGFVDIDLDGDYDLFVGEWDGIFNYFENTGSASSATFTNRTGVSNPLNGFDVGRSSTPRFININDDNDWDMFSGERGGIFNFYENLGSGTSPSFVQRTGASNPMDGFDVGRFSNGAYIDMDVDGDFDVVSGEQNGTFLYYENIGSRTAPSFVNRTGASNPLNGEDIGNYSAPIFLDLDNDGQADLMAGEGKRCNVLLYWKWSGRKPITC